MMYDAFQEEGEDELNYLEALGKEDED